MKVSLYNQKGKEIEKIDLNDSIYGVEVKESVISQYLYCYLSNQREGNAHTKTRAEVSGGGRKPWRQKGTGRARVGSSRSPIWRKGGIVFGPRSNRNWKKTMTPNFKLAALKNALSLATKEKNFFNVVEALEISEKKPLTKQAEEIKNNFEAKKITVVTAEKNDTIINAFSNLKGAQVITAKDLNTYDVISATKMIIEKSALNSIENRFKNKISKKTKTTKNDN